MKDVKIENASENRNEVLDTVISAVHTVGIDLILELPCDRIAPLLFEFSKEYPYIPLTREEEGVGIAAGVALTGTKPLMVVQSSGMGNMVNAILSLTKFYELPLPIIISHRGIYKENIPAQVPVGSRLEKILKAMDVEYKTFSTPSDLKIFRDELNETFQKNKVSCFLFSPKLFEDIPKKMLMSSKLKEDLKKRYNSSPVEHKGHEHRIINDNINLKTRYEVLVGLKDFLKNKAVICNMGYPSRELYSILDQNSNFYMMGSLGLVSSIGLGVSLYTANDVVVIDGDGSLLMNPNALLSISSLQPENLTVICIDNQAYGSTGNQPTLTADNFQLEELAKACNIRNILVTDQPEMVSEFGGPGPKFVKILAKPGNAKVGTIELSEIEIKNRFYDWLKS